MVGFSLTRDCVAAAAVADEWYNIATQSMQSSVDSFTSNQVDAIFDANFCFTYTSIFYVIIFGIAIFIFLSLIRIVLSRFEVVELIFLRTNCDVFCIFRVNFVEI